MGTDTTDKTYTARRDAILNDRSASFWLKGAIFTLEKRDPCDAVGDVEALLEVQLQRLADITGIRVEAGALIQRASPECRGFMQPRELGAAARPQVQAERS